MPSDGRRLDGFLCCFGSVCRMLIWMTPVVLVSEALGGIPIFVSLRRRIRLVPNDLEVFLLHLAPLDTCLVTGVAIGDLRGGTAEPSGMLKEREGVEIEIGLNGRPYVISGVGELALESAAIPVTIGTTASGPHIAYVAELPGPDLTRSGLRSLVSKPYYDIRDPWRKLIVRATSRRYEGYGLLRLHPLTASVIAWLSLVYREEVAGRRLVIPILCNSPRSR